MDPITHGLASYALKRAAFPHVSRSATLAILAAGTLADLDSLSRSFGPSAFLTFYRTYFHSFLAAILLSLFVALPFLFRKPGPAKNQTSFVTIFGASLAAAVLHLLMDLFQSAGVSFSGLFPRAVSRQTGSPASISGFWEPLSRESFSPCSAV
jgi:membrane-bound metal-dependent hydrolase YbcI (DUF457 family)